jgi:hypothetical protein
MKLLTEVGASACIYYSFCCTKKTKVFKPGDVQQVTKEVIKSTYQHTSPAGDGGKLQAEMNKKCGGSNRIDNYWSDVHGSVDVSEGHAATCN